MINATSNSLHIIRTTKIWNLIFCEWNIHGWIPEKSMCLDKLSTTSHFQIYKEEQHHSISLKLFILAIIFDFNSSLHLSYLLLFIFFFDDKIQFGSSIQTLRTFKWQCEIYHNFYLGCFFFQVLTASCWILVLFFWESSNNADYNHF